MGAFDWGLRCFLFDQNQFYRDLLRIRKRQTAFRKKGYKSDIVILIGSQQFQELLFTDAKNILTFKKLLGMAYYKGPKILVKMGTKFQSPSLDSSWFFSYYHFVTRVAVVWNVFTRKILCKQGKKNCECLQSKKCTPRLMHRLTIKHTTWYCIS